MCQEMNKIFFSDVNDTKDTWSILAKVLRKWSVKRKAAPYAVWKVGMLLDDEKHILLLPDYGHLSNAFNATLVTLNPNIPEANLMKERYKVHYKVYDDTGKCSIIFFYRHATELLGKSASKMKEDMQEVVKKLRTCNIRTISQENVIEDGDNTVSQLTTPPEAYTKRKTLGNNTPIVYEDLGLAEICTPKMSSTKPP
ncbi:hypothetical protein K1719_002881 [Acacia pycnantha]|nr:hypothetical protein K1719_002881 [Acacia pycnantha]